eukprot:760184-Hanusia_phi.AAC.5
MATCRVFSDLDGKLTSFAQRICFASRRIAVAQGLFQARARRWSAPQEAHATLNRKDSDRNANRPVDAASLVDKQTVRRDCASCISLHGEVKRLLDEREQLTKFVQTADESTASKVKQMQQEMLREAEGVKGELDSLRSQLNDARNALSAERQKLLVRIAVTESFADYSQTEEIERLGKELAEMNVVLKSQEEHAMHDINKAYQDAEESVRRLKSENLQLQKENGKQVVHIRQEKSDKEDRLKLSLMEERLFETQEALKELRKERNAAMATMRRMQREEESRRLQMNSSSLHRQAADVESETLQEVSQRKPKHEDKYSQTPEAAGASSLLVAFTEFALQNETPDQTAAVSLLATLKITNDYPTRQALIAVLVVHSLLFQSLPRPSCSKKIIAEELIEEASPCRPKHPDDSILSSDPTPQRQKTRSEAGERIETRLESLAATAKLLLLD